MPHYKSGTPAKPGDHVRGPGSSGEIEGYVLRVYPGTDTCNLAIGVTACRFESTGEIGMTEPRVEHVTACSFDILGVEIHGTVEETQAPPGQPGPYSGS